MEARKNHHCGVIHPTQRILLPVTADEGRIMTESDLQEQRRLAELLVTADPQTALEFQEMGEQFRKEQQLEKAAFCFRKAADLAVKQTLSPDTQCRIWTTLACILAEVDRPDEAEVCLRQVLKADEEKRLHVMTRIAAYDALVRLFQRVQRDAEAAPFAEARACLIEQSLRSRYAKNLEHRDGAQRQRVNLKAGGPAVNRSAVHAYVANVLVAEDRHVVAELIATWQPWYDAYWDIRTAVESDDSTLTLTKESPPVATERQRLPRAERSVILVVYAVPALHFHRRKTSPVIPDPPVTPFVWDLAVSHGAPSVLLPTPIAQECYGTAEVHIELRLHRISLPDSPGAFEPQLEVAPPPVSAPLIVRMMFPTGDVRQLTVPVPTSKQPSAWSLSCPSLPIGAFQSTTYELQILLPLEGRANGI